jgi:hypothetical protein
MHYHLHQDCRRQKFIYLQPANIVNTLVPYKNNGSLGGDRYVLTMNHTAHATTQRKTRE